MGIAFISKIWYNISMKKEALQHQNSPKKFSIATIDKEEIKSRSFDNMRTSFAIEGIHFSDEKFSAMISEQRRKK